MADSLDFQPPSKDNTTVTYNQNHSARLRVPNLEDFFLCYKYEGQGKWTDGTPTCKALFFQRRSVEWMAFPWNFHDNAFRFVDLPKNHWMVFWVQNIFELYLHRWCRWSNVCTTGVMTCRKFAYFFTQRHLISGFRFPHLKRMAPVQIHCAMIVNLYVGSPNSFLDAALNLLLRDLTAENPLGGRAFGKNQLTCAVQWPHKGSWKKWHFPWRIRVIGFICMDLYHVLPASIEKMAKGRPDTRVTSPESKSGLAALLITTLAREHPAREDITCKWPNRLRQFVCSNQFCSLRDKTWLNWCVH